MTYKELKKSATSGDATAQRKLAIYLWERNKTSVVSVMSKTTDTHKALKWFKQAASQNDIYSLLFLALHYFFGDVLKKNEKQGIECLERAATNGSQFAAAYLTHLFGKSYCNIPTAEEYDNISKGLMKILPHKTQNEPKRKIQWLHLLAEKYKDTAAMWQLGIIYFNGTDETKTDIKLARKMLKKSAEGGFNQALPIYAIMLICGIGGKKDGNKGWDYVKTGIDNDDWYSYVIAAGIYMNTSGKTIKDGDIAFRLLLRYYNLSKEKAMPEALFLIGKAWFEGEIIFQNLKEARFYMDLSAAKGHPIAKEVVEKWDEYCQEAATCYQTVDVPEYYVTDNNITDFLHNHQPDDLPTELYDRICKLITNYRQRIEQGDALACISLSCLYDNGVVLGQSSMLADICLEVAEDLGNTEAMRLLAFRYAGMHSTPLRPSVKHQEYHHEAITHAKRCFNTTNKATDAKLVGDMCYQVQDYEQAIDYYKKAEQLGMDCTNLISKCCNELQLQEMRRMRQQIEYQEDVIRNLRRNMMDMQYEMEDRQAMLQSELRSYERQLENVRTQNYGSSSSAGFGKCGLGDLSCAGGGGQCGINIGCAGGGRDSLGFGKCGLSDLSCAGGGGQCGINIGCAGGGA